MTNKNLKKGFVRCYKHASEVPLPLVLKNLNNWGLKICKYLNNLRHKYINYKKLST